MKLLVRLLALTLFTSTAALAQSLTGEWDASMNTPGGARTFKILFAQSGEKLTGTVKRPTGDVPLTGTAKGKEVFFTYLINYGDKPLAMEVTATLAGNEMTGKIDLGGQVQEAFSAKRAATTPATPHDLQEHDARR
jgi:hypothetical protein